MRAITLRARSVLPGDLVTGVWSDYRSRWDHVEWSAERVTHGTAPDGTPIATIHTGPQAWQQSTICADTIVRVRVP